MQAIDGSPVITALQGAWSAIRDRHPEVPAAVVITGPVPGQKSASEADVLNGHHWPEQWTGGPDEAGRAVMTIAPELLVQGGRAIVEALLHAGAHGLAAARGTRDTSAAGHRYHNKRFVALAEELGLSGPGQPESVTGWSGCTLTGQAAAAYAAAIAAIDEAWPPYAGDLPYLSGRPAGRQAEGEDGPARRAGRRQPAECECQPPRRIQLTPRQLEVGPILCGVCGAQFRVPSDDGHQDDEE